MSLTLLLLAALPHATKAAEAMLHGSILDREDGTPVARVVVLAGSALIAGATPPPYLPRGVVATLTDESGNFELPANVARGAYVEVLPADGHVALHTRLPYATSHLDVRLLRATAAELAWLNQLNRDRAANGVAPVVVLDEIAEETARYRAASMANSGDYRHADAFSHYEALGGIYPPGGGSAAENIDAIFGPSTWQQAQRNFMVEKCNVTHTCPNGPIFGGETGHYEAIVNPTAVWAGIAIAANGKAPATVPGGRTDYYAQVFVNAP
jgi:uncharacterized protein YkwD